MESINEVTQYPLSSIQLKGIKTIIKNNINMPIGVIIDKIKEYTSVISYIKSVDDFLDNKTHSILIRTIDTCYFLKIKQL